ncbi:natural cytotoxicity triggering receptor 3 [Rhinatrema bivittatum]|uniref:natural cytotoxicity triggering receptor 3 n=1 Tax=Rhinatrema bivittatum TaxID=194408 RepID=UPI001128063F|nr:natural cytotoxicity triggering receptor 3 [Rhinatrema bivittatum]
MKGGIQVLQVPSSIYATKGENVTLSCKFTSSVMPAIGVSKWYRQAEGAGSKVEITSQVIAREFGNRLVRGGSEEFSRKHDASLHILDLQVSDSGVYFCEVGLLGYRNVLGVGTRLWIEASNQEDVDEITETGRTDLAILIAMACIVALAIAFMICLLRMYRTREGFRSRTLCCRWAGAGAMTGNEDQTNELESDGRVSSQHQEEEQTVYADLAVDRSPGTRAGEERAEAVYAVLLLSRSQP